MKLTEWKRGLTSSVPNNSTKLANPSFNQISFHHFIVTKLPNHYLKEERDKFNNNLMDYEIVIIQWIHICQLIVYDIVG